MVTIRMNRVRCARGDTDRDCDMKIRVGKLRQIIREAFVGMPVNAAKIHDANGVTYRGDKEKIIRALISYGTSHEEREAIVTGRVPINKSALMSLKRKNLIRPESLPERPRKSQYRSPGELGRSGTDRARKQYEKAVKTFADNSMDFKRDREYDLGDEEFVPSDYASDMADGFFFEYPQWKQWASKLGLSRRSVKEYVADMIASAWSE